MQVISPQIPVCIVATIISDKLTWSKQFTEWYFLLLSQFPEMFKEDF